MARIHWKFLVPFITILMILLLLNIWLKAKNEKATVLHALPQDFTVPKLILSLPATISYMNYQQVLPETTAAAILDLVRKGNVKKVEEGRFLLIHSNGLLEHERWLVEWLFDEISAKDEFTFDDITPYLQNKENHTKYVKMEWEWKQAIRKEVLSAGFYDKKVGFRLLLGFLSIAFIPLIVLFAIHGLNLFGVTMTVVALFLLVISVFYSPKTLDGVKTSIEWKNFQQKLQHITQADWLKLTEDEKMRAFIYGLGKNDKIIKKQNESFIKAFQAPSNQVNVYSFDPSWLIIATIASTNFRTANETTTPSGSSGGTIGGGGSGKVVVEVDLELFSWGLKGQKP
ncbi:DUF2207 family protein [Bacillus alkalisoli]|uniref:DUF2207 family protein n=1 Tax=Bacillus alkalisoli TaxID=2011008 RepID=UPI000C23FA53|nr:DUF2207 domain-containing protein [Bacillus alkalisoli]